LKKTKETKEILKEWRKFEFKSNINESQATPAPIKRVKYTPTKEAKELCKELEDIHGKNTFHCYDRFDGHGDDEMIHPEYGYQIEYESLVEHVKGMSEFPSDIEVGDIVMTDDDTLLDTGGRGLRTQNLGSFDVAWPTGPYRGDMQKYYYGEIDVNGRMQKVIYRVEHGFTIYCMFPDKKSEPANDKSFKGKLGGVWN